MTFDLTKTPPPPAEQDWTFIEELRTKSYHQHVVWTRRKPQSGEVFFPDGLRLEPQFDDTRCLLDTAFRDFRYFLSTVGLRRDGAYPVVIRRIPTSMREEYRLRINEAGCKLGANDTEGIRRGLVWIEDELLRRGGPFLPRGRFTRQPLIRTRISRCFYGPINRPPKCKDELADEVDYYPDEYLNRLAHEGVNGLWLTIHFFNTVPSKIIPEYGRNAGPRLAKLRRVVQKCGRYGIKIYPFCIEPAAFTWPQPEIAAAAAAHPDLKGHQNAFCTSTEKGQAYLEEATRTLFSEVPGLGGLMVIPVGERFTHCYSGAIPQGGSSFVATTPNTCPRCSRRRPWAVLADTLAGLARGMQSVDAEAELIAWPYGQSICWGAEKTVEAAGHIPANVILQHNFETGGGQLQLRKWRPTWDYWLSYVGPSSLFRDCAKAARRQGIRISAKLQVSCSHEVATTQVVPAPGILYQKYRRMHRLGVSAAMHSWYFGAYPSLMTQAAGLLSFAPFPARERDFLLALAQRDWGRHAAAIVKAWQCFQQGYSQYPTAHIFGYFGPMHDGPVWPLHLVPQRRPLAPTWQIGYPPSGDYIAECVTNGFTLAEKITLCRRMATHWNRGVRIMQRLRRRFQTNPDRIKDIGIATALGIQFQSGYNILHFYALRETLAETRLPAKRGRILKAMRAIVRAELKNDAVLLPLATADSRLGFHSEAEGYKYFPALIRWRMAQLRRLLQHEFPAVARKARRHEPLFPEYTGEQPAGAVYTCHPLANAPAMDGRAEGALWDALPQAKCTYWLHQKFNAKRRLKCAYDPHDHLPLSKDAAPDCQVFWQAGYDATALYFGLLCRAGRNAGQLPDPFQEHSLQVYLEPKRTLPRIIFALSPDGAVRRVRDDGYISRSDDAWRVHSRLDPAGWSVILQLPFRALGLTGHNALRMPIRINVVLSRPLAGQEGTALCSWVKTQPAKGRLVWGYLNPATDFGWLRFSARPR